MPAAVTPIGCDYHQVKRARVFDLEPATAARTRRVCARERLRHHAFVACGNRGSVELLSLRYKSGENSRRQLEPHASGKFSQVLVASTYPLEVIQLQQWLAQHKDLKDRALADAVAKQDWDPSIQSLAGLPDLVKLLSENIKWTTDLGNAFLAQQNDVMDAVQRMRKKAQDNGNLKSNEQQKVEVKTVESKQVIVVEQANPQVVYVPSYNPTVVYGAPVYAYPPIAYPPPGYYAAGMAISFGVGVAMGAFWGGGGWGYNCGWHGGNNNITINNNNNFNRNSNINGGRNNIGNGNRPSQLPSPWPETNEGEQGLFARASASDRKAGIV